MKENCDHRELALQAKLTDYNVCATEIQNRSDRQNLLVNLQFTAMGLIVATVLVEKADVGLFLIVAVLAPLIGLLWLDHATVISGLGRYIASEIEPYITMRLLQQPNVLHREQGYSVRPSRRAQDQATRNFSIPYKTMFLAPTIITIPLYVFVRGQEVITEVRSQTQHCTIPDDPSLNGQILAMFGGPQYQSCGWQWYVVRGVGIVFCIYAGYLAHKFARACKVWQEEDKNRRQDLDFTLARRFTTGLYSSGVASEEAPWFFNAKTLGLSVEGYFRTLRQAAQKTRSQLESPVHPISPVLEPLEVSGEPNNVSTKNDPKWLVNTDDWDGVEPRKVKFKLWFSDGNGNRLPGSPSRIVTMKVQFGTIVEYEEHCAGTETSHQETAAAVL